MRPLLLLAFLVSGAALGADFAQGELAFTQACSNCHTATQAREGQAPPPRRHPKALPHVGPDLGVALKTGGATRFKRWVKDPWAVQPNTACDPRLLSSEQLENLITFLSSRTRAEPPPKRRSPMFRRRS